ncbi:uncharacterized protein LOC135502818 [Lineus longissimus]|uniref:uncharacterized protein LOC135502818 n=1 Tax=Lineus longissimus TaxID=88925 RepID=UPI002B4D4F65
MRLCVFIGLLTVALHQLLQVSSELTFEGCYAGILEHQGESSFRQMNDNGACVEDCRQKGYILAATRSKECHCTHSFPTQRIASGGSVFASGKDSSCNMPCPGIVETDGCRADECCGGRTKDGDKAYSVYAVGGIDVPAQVWKRVQKNLFDNIDTRRYGRMLLLWQQLACEVFEPFASKVMSRQKNIKTAASLARCQSYCDREVSFACLAYSYTQIQRDGENYLGECKLYDHLTPLTNKDANTKLFIRKCILDNTSGNSASAGPPTVLYDGGDITQEGIRGFLTTRKRPLLRNSWAKVCMSDKADSNNLVADIGCRQIGFYGGYAWPYRAEESEPMSLTRVELLCREGANTLQECVWKSRSTCPKGAMYVYCIGRGPIMINKRLSLELQNYKRELEDQMPLSLTPMESYDLELDNINSNVNQMQTYMKETEESSQMVWRSETGFQEGQSKTISSTKSKAWSVGGSVGTSLDMSVSATVGGGFLTAKASVTTEVATSLNTEVSHATSGRSTDSSSGTKATKNIFSEGFSKTVTKVKSVRQTYNLMVPPFHRGFMNFFKEEVPMTLKWRSTFWLGGNIELQYGPLQKNISVVNLLINTQRTFFTLGSLSYKTTKLISQITLKDSNGKTTAPIDPNGAQCSQPDCKRWYGDEAMCDGVACVTDFAIDCNVDLQECLKENSELICER